MLKMTGPTFLSLVLLFAFLDVRIATEVDVLRVAVPHDAYPGYSIAKLKSWGQSFTLLDNSEHSYLFTILNDGLLMPTSDIRHLLDAPPVTLVVKQEAENGTKEQTLVLHVVDKERMVHFNRESYQFRISENEPVGSFLEDLNGLYAQSETDHQIVYTIVSGNDGNAFSVVQPVGNKTIVGLGPNIRTNKILDRESQDSYELILRATDIEESTSAETKILVEVVDVNDNAPVPERAAYEFRIQEDMEIYSIVGNVSAYDADGDVPVYHFVTRHPVFAIIPKTGQILLISTPELKTYKLSVIAQDVRKPSKTCQPFPVYVEVYSDELEFLEDALPSSPLNGGDSNEITLLRKKRSVRPTKSFEYKETDGSKPGRVMFQLDKKHPQEMYKIENPIKWVDVDSNGEVKIKEPWDFEQLGKEKTIDFWVYVTGPNLNEPERQRVIIHLKDVNDEPPYFINRPLPMQAVVQLNAPPGTPVFKLQARDPDTDHNIHYFLVRDRSDYSLNYFFTLT